MTAGGAIPRLAAAIRFPTVTTDTTTAVRTVRVPRMVSLLFRRCYWAYTAVHTSCTRGPGEYRFSHAASPRPYIGVDGAKYARITGTAPRTNGIITTYRTIRDRTPCYEINRVGGTRARSDFRLRRESVRRRRRPPPPPPSAPRTHSRESLTSLTGGTRRR